MTIKQISIIKRAISILEDLRFSYDHQHDSTCKAGGCIWFDAQTSINELYSLLVKRG